MPNVILQVKNLVKKFEKTRAVNGVSFHVYEGEILGLLGPNGAGKTTLIAMLLGVLTPTSGTISIFDLDFQHNREKILSQVNFSSTYISMPLSLSVKENLIFFSKLYHVPDYETRIRELLKLCEIEHLGTHLTRDLSTGQLSRLNLVKALLNRPRILFLDEPTASLDPDMADKARELLKNLKNRFPCTIIYTSHNMKEMEQISDRIIFLNRGEIIAEGSPRQIMALYRKKNLEEVFLEVVRGEVPDETL
ncbi:MAG: ABC transporter ATP-binding protein [Nitrospirae bacterium]|nr:ABC transporter ATP-binding protein [Nitrospirota bacterium]MBI3352443.1 ABC transporter ATP-binding protein [Nitrospirota bacterium]